MVIYVSACCKFFYYAPLESRWCSGAKYNLTPWTCSSSDSLLIMSGSQMHMLTGRWSWISGLVCIEGVLRLQGCRPHFSLKGHTLPPPVCPEPCLSGVLHRLLCSERLGPAVLPEYLHYLLHLSCNSRAWPAHSLSLTTHCCWDDLSSCLTLEILVNHPV